MTDRLTILCPDAYIDDANQLAMVLGYGPADALTFGTLDWQDADGNLYAAASLEVGEGFVTDAQRQLERPVWDNEPYTINMAGAERAQALVSIWGLGVDEPPPVAVPNALLALFHPDPHYALGLIGLKHREIEGVGV